MRFITLILALLLPLPLTAEERIRVAVAANFRGTLEHLNSWFEAETGLRVILSSASTGVLYNQILHGAPFDLFFAADTRAPGRLVAAGRGASFCYARGRLALVGGTGQLSALGDPALSLAIANPGTAPYGVAATEVLARPEFSAAGERKLIRGNNVAQAYQFWRSGGADMALVARSLAPGGIPIPRDWHDPLEQHAIVLTPAEDREAVQRYVSWIRSDSVRSNLLEAGYDPCP